MMINFKLTLHTVTLGTFLQRNVKKKKASVGGWGVWGYYCNSEQRETEYFTQRVNVRSTAERALDFQTFTGGSAAKTLERF